MRHIPNIITLIRLILIVPFLLSLFSNQYIWAFIFFIIAAVSDGIDGYLARRYHWQSHTGEWLDPLADKLLVACSFFSLGYLGQLPWWLVILVFSRDVTVMSGVLTWQKLFGHIEFKPTIISKLNTFMQCLVVLMVLFTMSIYPLPHWLFNVSISLLTLTTSASFVHYVLVWGKKARQRLGYRGCN